MSRDSLMEMKWISARRPGALAPVFFNLLSVLGKHILSLFGHEEIHLYDMASDEMIVQRLGGN